MRTEEEIHTPFELHQRELEETRANNGRTRTSGLGTSAHGVVDSVVVPEPSIISESKWRVPRVMSEDSGGVRTSNDFNVVNAL